MSDQVSGDTGRTERAKVDVDVAYLRQLLKTAIRNDTVVQWAAVAMDWAEAADAKIRELEPRALAPEPSGVPPAGFRKVTDASGNFIGFAEARVLKALDAQCRATTEVEWVARATLAEVFPDSVMRDKPLGPEWDILVARVVARLGATPQGGCPVSEPTVEQRAEWQRLRREPDCPQDLLAATVYARASAFFDVLAALERAEARIKELEDEMQEMFKYLPDRGSDTTCPHGYTAGQECPACANRRKMDSWGWNG